MEYRAMLLDSKYDDLFKVIASPDFGDDSFGDVESPSGFVTLVTVDSIDELKASLYQTHVDEADLDLVQELELGQYITTQDSAGLIWVFFYPRTPEGAGAFDFDSQELRDQYETWSDVTNPLVSDEDDDTPLWKTDPSQRLAYADAPTSDEAPC